MEEKEINVGGVTVHHDHIAVQEGTGSGGNVAGAKAKVVHNVSTETLGSFNGLLTCTTRLRGWSTHI